MDSARSLSRSPTRRRWAPRWLGRVGAVLLLTLVPGTLIVASSSPGGAQATFVDASVRTVPALPEPGQDVTVAVRVSGCSPGATDVQVLLAANPEGGVVGTLMADAPARTSLLWRTSAHIQLHDAVQGWYGVRIQCGQYQPDQVPMPNTSFAVGANPATTMSLSARTVPQGGSVTLSGTHCPGSSVDYEIVARAHNSDEFIPTASIPTQAGGSWTGQIPVPTALDPGPVLVRARCVMTNQLGATVYVSYGTPLDLRIEPPS